MIKDTLALLDAKEKPNYFILSNEDWDKYFEELPKDLKDFYNMFALNRAIDPRTGNWQAVHTYRGKPVFKETYD